MKKKLTLMLLLGANTVSYAGPLTPETPQQMIVENLNKIEQAVEQIKNILSIQSKKEQEATKKKIEAEKEVITPVTKPEKVAKPEEIVKKEAAEKIKPPQEQAIKVHEDQMAELKQRLTVIDSKIEATQNEEQKQKLQTERKHLEENIKRQEEMITMLKTKVADKKQ